MKSLYEGLATIFRHERNGRVWYTVAIGQQNMDGETEYGYKQIQFKRGVDIANRAKINIKSAWEKFYTSRNDEVVFYIFVSDFELVEGNAKMPQKPSVKHEDPQQTFEEIDEDVPF